MKSKTDKPKQPRSLVEILKEVLPLQFYVHRALRDVEKITWNGFIMN